MVGEAGCVVETCGSLGSLNLVISGKWGLGCTFGDECLLSRRVLSQGPKFGAEAAGSPAVTLLCSVFPGERTVLLAPSTTPFC